MSLAERIQKEKAKPLQQYQRPPVWEDPRPDLSEDHHLWKRFLKLAANMPDEKEAYELTGVLNGMRCGGTLLVQGKNGGYVLRPLIDPERGWASQEDYEELRDKFLKPHFEKVKVVLKLLNEDAREGRI